MLDGINTLENSIRIYVRKLIKPFFISYLPKRKESTHLCKDLNMSAHRRFIHNCTYLEIPQMSINVCVTNSGTVNTTQQEKWLGGSCARL